MKFIEVPFKNRPVKYVKLSYSMGYDQDGNFRKNAVAHVSVMDHWESIESSFNYAAESRELAEQKAHELGLDFVIVSYN